MKLIVDVMAAPLWCQRRLKLEPLPRPGISMEAKLKQQQQQQKFQEYVERYRSMPI